MTSVRLRHVLNSVVEKSNGLQADFVGLEDVEPGTGRVLWENVQPKGALDAVRFAAGDVLFSKLRPYLSKSFLADRDATATAELLVMRPGPELLGPYLRYVVSSRPFVDWAVTSSYGAQMPRTSWEAVSDYRMDLPTLDEQSRIADFLDAETARIDRLLALEERLMALVLERFASARERALITSERRTVPLHHLTDPRRPIVYGIVQAGEEVPDGVPYIKTGDLMSLNPAKLSRTSAEIDRAYRRARVHPGDLVIAMRASIGLAVKVPSDLPHANLTQGTARIAPREGVDLDWVFHVLRTNNVQDQCQARAVGSTYRTLNIWDLRRIAIPTPAARDMAALGMEVEGLSRAADRHMGLLRQKQGRLLERRSAVITAAVMGELDVTTARGAA